MKKTKWYPGDMKPTRKGVYERDLSGPNKMYGMTYWPYSYWNGKRWHAGSTSPETNLGALRVHSQQELPWRGLAAKGERA